MKKFEGRYSCINGLIVTQCSVWNIVNSRGDKQIKKLIKKISERNKHRGTVTVIISVEIEE